MNRPTPGHLARQPGPHNPRGAGPAPTHYSLCQTSNGVSLIVPWDTDTETGASCFCEIDSEPFGPPDPSDKFDAWNRTGRAWRAIRERNRHLLD